MRRLLPLLFLLPTAALAQDAEPEVRYQDRTEIDFERALDIQGELVKPKGVVVVETRRKGFNPLIELRVDFKAELAATAREIQ
jgi:hypothetical protein